MKIKRFFAKDMRTALKEVKEVLGADAVIMSNKKVANGIELVAAIDDDAPSLTPQDQPINQAPKSAPNSAKEEKIASSLQALLTRQQKSGQVEEPLTNIIDDLPGINTNPNHPINLNQQQKSPAQQKNSILADQIKQHLKSPTLNPAFSEQKTSPQPDPPLASGNTGQIDALQEEVAAIRELLVHQVSGLMWQDLARKSPIRAFIFEQLKQLGIAKSLAEQLLNFVSDDMSQQEAWKTVLKLIANQITSTDNEILGKGGVFALVGPTGIGKTTTIAKLAACFAQIYGVEQVGLVTTDTYRIGAHEQLATYGKIMGCPVKIAKDTEELSHVLYQLRNRQLVLIDTAGMSQRDIRLSEQLATLMQNSHVNIKSYLVLSATMQRRVVEEATSLFKRIPLSGCIITKVDECLSLGEIISVTLQNALPIGYLTNGQRVPEDIEVVDARRLINQAITMMKHNQSQYTSGNDSQIVGMYER